MIIDVILTIDCKNMWLRIPGISSYILVCVCVCVCAIMMCVLAVFDVYIYVQKVVQRMCEESSLVEGMMSGISLVACL